MIASVKQFLSWIDIHDSIDENIINSVCMDSRQVRAGSVFFALPGEITDGHMFIADALKKGAVLIITDECHPATDKYKDNDRVYAVKDTITALQAAATAYRSTFDYPVIAITGTNGKTTTKEILTAVLSKKYSVNASPGNLNNHLGVPLSIFQWSMQADMAVVEMGMNHPGEIARLCEIARPTHGVITNIGSGHLAFLKDLDGVANAKSELLEYLSDNGIAYLNGDDPMLKERIGIVQDCTTFGFSVTNQVKGEVIDSYKNGYYGLRFENIDMCVPLLGQHNLMNALAAVTIGRSFNVALPEIKKAIEEIVPVKQRMQLSKAGEVKIINDSYNANPSSMHAALKSLAEIECTGKRYAVLGDMAEMGESSESAHQQVGELISELAIDRLYLFGAAMSVAEDSANRCGFDHTYHFEEHRSMIEILIKEVQPGDALLIKGSRSMRMEIVAEELIAHFSSY
ncbi:UDP-N-acetylmuramoyl-tripeptide--D-alanyl-D-alanine ligase [bacterium]|nr:UDP-N-acetylmuramoyl-tripeptide--D-alanyl-D-alanine ligase [bacterium]